MNWVLDLLAAIDIFDFEFRKSVAPAAEAEVSIFQQLVEQRLPQDYRDFLALLGGDSSGLFWHERVNTNLSVVTAYCERHRALGADFKSARCIPIGVGFDFDGFGLDLTEERPHSPVVSLHGIRPKAVAFKTLPAMAFTHAFLYEQGATGKMIRVTSISNLKARETVEEKLVSHGYVTEWFSSDRKRFLRRDSALFSLVRYPAGFVDIYLGSREQEGIRQALADLEASIGGYEYQPYKIETLRSQREPGGS